MGLETNPSFAAGLSEACIGQQIEVHSFTGRQMRLAMLPEAPDEQKSHDHTASDR
jgi:hypothetical protein